MGWAKTAAPPAECADGCALPQLVTSALGRARVGLDSEYACDRCGTRWRLVAFDTANRPARWARVGPAAPDFRPTGGRVSSDGRLVLVILGGIAGILLGSAIARGF